MELHTRGVMPRDVRHGHDLHYAQQRGRFDVAPASERSKRMPENRAVRVRVTVVVEMCDMRYVYRLEASMEHDASGATGSLPSALMGVRRARGWLRICRLEQEA
jgi:hypothetical protein